MTLSAKKFDGPACLAQHTVEDEDKSTKDCQPTDNEPDARVSKWKRNRKTLPYWTTVPAYPENEQPKKTKDHARSKKFGGPACFAQQTLEDEYKAANDRQPSNDEPGATVDEWVRYRVIMNTDIPRRMIVPKVNSFSIIFIDFRVLGQFCVSFLPYVLAHVKRHEGSIRFQSRCAMGPRLRPFEQKCSFPGPPECHQAARPANPLPTIHCFTSSLNHCLTRWLQCVGREYPATGVSSP